MAFKKATPWPFPLLAALPLLPCGELTGSAERHTDKFAKNKGGVIVMPTFRKSFKSGSPTTLRERKRERETI